MKNTSDPATATDYGDDALPQIGDNILAQIDATANQLMEAMLEVDGEQEHLKAKQDRVRDLSERQLPELLDAARQLELKTASGLLVKLNNVVRASISEAKKVNAFKWLRKQGHGAIIKTTIEIPFQAGQDKHAQELKAFLEFLMREDVIKTLQGLYPKETKSFKNALVWLGNSPATAIRLISSVHAQSLAALVRELLKDGKIDQPSLDTLGAHVQKTVTVKPVER